MEIIADTFTIDRNTGLITVGRPPRGNSGTHNVTVRVCDDGQPQMCGTGLVTVTITAQNNYPPVWVFPRFNNESLDVLEVCGILSVVTVLTL